MESGGASAFTPMLPPQAAKAKPLQNSAIGSTIPTDHHTMSVRVEFYGVPRQRTGQSSIDLPVRGSVPLGTILAQLGQMFPKLAADCLEGNRIRPGYVVNVDGNQFVLDPESLIDDNTSLLLMSADAGG